MIVLEAGTVEALEIKGTLAQGRRPLRELLGLLA
jgi:hypothetical protein